jgi:multisubunit Na+/H+ antiporter MnhB subunit
MQIAWHDLIGSIGVAVIILTYVALQTEKIRSDSLAYSLLNAAGAGLIIVSLLYSFNFPAFIVEFFWLLISLFGVGKYFLRKNNVRDEGRGTRDEG